MFFERKDEPEADRVEIEGPAFTRTSSTTRAPGWSGCRSGCSSGFEWLEAGWEKLTGTGWVDGGSALLGYWKNAVAVPGTGTPSITFEWYRSFLQVLIDNHAQGWFAGLITFGELAVGWACSWAP